MFKIDSNWVVQDEKKINRMILKVENVKIEKYRNAWWYNSYNTVLLYLTSGFIPCDLMSFDTNDMMDLTLMY